MFNSNEFGVDVVKVGDPGAYIGLTLHWWSCVISNKRGRVSALLGPRQHALIRM